MAVCCVQLLPCLAVLQWPEELVHGESSFLWGPAPRNAAAARHGRWVARPAPGTSVWKTIWPLATTVVCHGRDACYAPPGAWARRARGQAGRRGMDSLQFLGWLPLVLLRWARGAPPGVAWEVPPSLCRLALAQVIALDPAFAGRPSAPGSAADPGPGVQLGRGELAAGGVSNSWSDARRSNRAGAAGRPHIPVVLVPPPAAGPSPAQQGSNCPETSQRAARANSVAARPVAAGGWRESAPLANKDWRLSQDAVLALVVKPWAASRPWVGECEVWLGGWCVARSRVGGPGDTEAGGSRAWRGSVPPLTLQPRRRFGPTPAAGCGQGRAEGGVAR